MSTRNYARLTILFFIVTSCGTGKEDPIRIVDFSQIVSFYGNPIEEIEVPFKRPSMEVLVVDTFLVIKADIEPLFRIYSTKSHKLLTSFGALGEGPQELSGFMTLLKHRDHDIQNKSPVFSVFDPRRQIVARINIMHQIEDPDYNYQVESLTISPGHFFVYFFHSDNELLIGQLDGLTRLWIYERAQSKQTFIRSIPEPPFPISVDYWGFVYRSSAVINKNLGRIALAPTLLGQLDYFQLDGTYINSAYFDDPLRFKEYISRNLKSGNESYYYILSLESNGEHIHALNQNNSASDYMITGANNREILVFDWDGNPVKKYVFADGRPILSASYDHIHNRFYTFSPDEPEHNIVVYEMDE